MPLVDLNKPGEKKKVIWASVLGLVAIIFLWWTFIGFGSSSPRASVKPTATPTPQRAPTGQNNVVADNRTSPAPFDLATIRPVDFQISSYEAPEAKRNIFAFFVPPPPPTPAAKIETPSPTPQP